MGLQRFCIELDNSVGVFFPGQIITGKVHIWNNSGEKTFKGLHLECKGMATVSFPVQRGKRKVRRQSSIEYFNFKSCITEGQESFKIDNGQHEYPFWFSLPDSIPSSYESIEGNVRYTIGAILDRPWKTNTKYKTAFTVNTVVDLNLDPEAQVMCKRSKSKNLGFCFVSGPLRADVWIERKGYVPGENILFCAHVDNQSGEKMKFSRVQLIETAVYMAQGSSKVSERVLHITNHESFREADVWDNFAIPVPPVAPSGLPNCSIIDVSYKIKFRVCHLGCTPTYLTIDLPIIIGNVPLRNNFPSFECNSQPSAPIMPFPNDNGAVSYEDLPPPNYEQACNTVTFQGEQDPDNFNNGALIEFNPRYATYKRSV